MRISTKLEISTVHMSHVEHSPARSTLQHFLLIECLSSVAANARHPGTLKVILRVHWQCTRAESWTTLYGSNLQTLVSRSPTMRGTSSANLLTACILSRAHAKITTPAAGGKRIRHMYIDVILKDSWLSLHGSQSCRLHIQQTTLVSDSRTNCGGTDSACISRNDRERC